MDKWLPWLLDFHHTADCRHFYGYKQEGGGVSRQISGLVITTSVTSRRTSVIFDMAANFFASLTERNVEISNFLMIRLLCSMLPRIQNI